MAQRLILSNQKSSVCHKSLYYDSYRATMIDAVSSKFIGIKAAKQKITIFTPQKKVYMKSSFKFILGGILAFILTSCGTLNPVAVNMTDSLDNYKYFYITPTTGVSSVLSTVNNLDRSVYGSTTSNSANPADIISGFLMKKGFTRLPELVPELKDQTVVINYGESGVREILFGRITEVTIQLLSAKTMQPIGVCTSEGYGDTQADDIRIALNRGLEKLFEK